MPVIGFLNRAASGRDQGRAAAHALVIGADVFLTTRP
jgi:hypothetical protein